MSLDTAGPTMVAEDYLAALLDGDLARALAVVRTLLREGRDPGPVVEQVLAAAQARVGDAWAGNRLSVAHEHRATAITEAALQVVAREGARSQAPPTADRCPVYVVCCEGEWHTLPARMATEVLCLSGFPATLVGPSLPATEVAEFLGAEPPPVVLVTCSLPQHLVGAWRTVSAVRAVGARTICGGSGFGPDGTWAAAVGGDAYAATFTAGVRAVARALAAPPPLPRPAGGSAAGIAELDFLHSQTLVVAAEVQQAVRRAGAAFGRPTPVWGGSEDDVTPLLSSVCSAAVVDDPRVATDFVAWLEAVNAARGLSLVVVGAAFSALAESVPVSCPHVHRMAGLAAESCTQPG